MMQELLGFYGKRKLEFCPETSALLVIDMQEYFLDKNSHAFLSNSLPIIPKIKKLIKFFRKKKRPVIFTQHVNTLKNAKMLKEWWNDLITAESPLCNLSKKIYLPPGAPVVVKTQYDAFYKTNLKKLLNKYQAKQIVITGVMTNLCCETTARSAFVKGFQVFFVVDGTVTQNEAMHRATLINLAYGFAVPVCVDDLIRYLKN